MRIATKEEIRQVDKKVIEEYGMEEIVLMENAGKKVAQAVEEFFDDIGNKSVFVAAGMGNNGGDALVAARYLLNYNARVKVFLVGNIDHMTKSASSNYNILKYMHADIYHIGTEYDWDKVRLSLGLADAVVDGICGTGINLPLRLDQQKMVACINSAHKPVVAIDIPSGLDADTGSVHEGQAVKAAITVTMGIPKIGLLLYPGACYVGKVIIDSIGIPLALLNDKAIQQRMIDRYLVKKFIPVRSMEVHKANCGRVLVLAGSIGYTGAAALCAQAALRLGAGLVTLAAAKSLYPIFAEKLTEVIVMPLPEEEEGILGMQAAEVLLPREESYDTILMGPGLGRSEKTMEFVRNFAVAVKKPLVLDADAIFAFAGHAEELKNCAFIPILTPHLGEMASLLQIKVKELKNDLWKYARNAAAKYNCVFILKSEKTIVACPDGNIFLTTVGNPGMATAGCGDVLAGVTAALRADRLDGKKAAVSAVFLHGTAGDIAAKRGMAGLTAGDILDSIQSARKYVDGK